uniref:Uncharacterized protein n=1 Tax=Calidris pygmaea TaxID=425635 RepID=A0A8C3JTV9_9CHAR
CLSETRCLLTCMLFQSPQGMDVCPCLCFGLGSWLCADFMALVHSRLVTATLQPLYLPVATIFSPSPFPGLLYQKASGNG